MPDDADGDDDSARHPSAASSETAADRLVRLGLLNDEFANAMARQTASADRIDAKVTVLLGFVFAGVPIALAHHLARGFAVAGVTAAAGTVLAGLWCLRPRRFSDVPRPDKFVNTYRSASLERTLGALVGTRSVVFARNDKVRQTKTLWWYVTTLGTISTGVLLSIAVARGK